MPLAIKSFHAREAYKKKYKEKTGNDLPSNFDFDEANYTWHHHQDGKSMMLVPREVHHNKTVNGHVGGKAIIELQKDKNLGKDGTFKGLLPSPSDISSKWLNQCK